MIAVGSTIYRFDRNRRKYNGTGISARIIYAEHFEPFEITGETKQSWLVSIYSRETKINKKTLREAGANRFDGFQWFTKDEMEADIWAQKHRRNLVREIESASVQTLKKVAEVLGYDAL